MPADEEFEVKFFMYDKNRILMNSTLRVNKTMMQTGCYAKWVGIFSSPLGIEKEDNVIVLKNHSVAPII